MDRKSSVVRDKRQEVRADRAQLSGVTGSRPGQAADKESGQISQIRTLKVQTKYTVIVHVKIKTLLLRQQSSHFKTYWCADIGKGSNWPFKCTRTNECIT